MDLSLLYLLVFLSLFLSAFVIYLLLSTCLGPPLLSWARARLAAHYRASRGGEWDNGGAGYRELRRRTGGFAEGRGGAEGYEMASLG